MFRYVLTDSHRGVGTGGGTGRSGTRGDAEEATSFGFGLGELVPDKLMLPARAAAPLAEEAAAGFE